tara:strand:+ start:4929 stop:5621 length:693 start_codon:yes stop_codon:yes gene_type:complete
MHGGVTSLSNLVPPVDLNARDSVALVVIDMQYHDAWPDRGVTAALERVNPGSMSYFSDRLRQTTIPSIQQLLAHFRVSGLPVIHLVLGSDYRDLRDCPPRFRTWTRNLEALTGLDDVWWAGNSDFSIIEPLAPLPEETVIQKSTNGAFNGSRFNDFLRQSGIDTLVLTGVVTSACVETTARDAADRGYNCALVSDACADYDPDMHEATMRAFALNFGQVQLSADDIIRQM